MRCKSCNVDLSENAKKCPLCGEPAVNEEPVLKGLQTAYYPKVKYRKPMPNYNLIFLIVWLVASAAVFVYDVIFSNGDLTYFLFTLTLIPCIWSLVLRPLYTERYYFGRFLMADVVFLIPWIIVLCVKLFDCMCVAFKLAIPGVLVVALLVVILEAVFVKKDRINAPIFVVMLGALSLLIMLLTLFISRRVWFVYLIPLALSVVELILLWIFEPEKIGQELKARLHF